MTGGLWDLPPDAGPSAPSWADSHAEIIDAAISYLKGRKTTGPGLIQRHVRVGFATASRLLEELEERGIVGPANGNGVRPVISAWAVGDRVLIARGHPWGGHTGTITAPFESPSTPDLKWTVAIDGGPIDGGPCRAAVAEADIRRTDH